MFDELYAHDAAVQAHMASNYFRVFGAAAETLASGPPTVVVTHPVDVE